MHLSGYLYILEQFVCALGLLMTAARAAGIPRTPPWRLLCTSLLISLASLLAALYPSLVLRLAMLMLTFFSPRAVWPALPRSVRRVLPIMLFFLTLLYAGCIRFTAQLPLPSWLAVLAVSILTPLLARPHQPGLPACVTLEIRCGTVRTEITALIDTGNLLRDPLTALPVIVISRRAAQKLIPRPVPGQLNPGLRQIPIRTVAGISTMAVFRPDGLRILQSGSWQSVQAVVGVAPGGYDGGQALAPAALLHAASLTCSQGG